MNKVVFSSGRKNETQCVSLYVYVYVKSKSGEREGRKDLKYCICMNKKEIFWRKLIEFQFYF